jgi:hypothetical protein
LSYQHNSDIEPENGSACRTAARLQILAQSLEKHGGLSRAWLYPIFDFGKKLRLNPDAAMRNLFRVGLRPPD